jgi:stress response protein YsnF
MYEYWEKYDDYYYIDYEYQVEVADVYRQQIRNIKTAKERKLSSLISYCQRLKKEKIRLFQEKLNNFYY